MTKPALSLVGDKSDVIDIYAPIRAKIASIDWAACHVAGDRRPGVWLLDSRKGWAK